MSDVVAVIGFEGGQAPPPPKVMEVLQRELQFAAEKIAGSKTLKSSVENSTIPSGMLQAISENLSDKLGGEAKVVLVQSWNDFASDQYRVGFKLHLDAAIVDPPDKKSELAKLLAELYPD